MLKEQRLHKKKLETGEQLKTIWNSCLILDLKSDNKELSLVYPDFRSSNQRCPDLK